MSIGPLSVSELIRAAEEEAARKRFPGLQPGFAKGAAVSNGVGPLASVEELIRAAQEQESRRRMTHFAPPPRPPDAAIAGQSFLKGLIADLPEFFLNPPQIIGPFVPAPWGETPVQDVMRAHGILTEAGEPPAGDDQLSRQMQALAFFSRGLGGLVGAPTETALARGGAAVARGVGRELETAGAGRVPWRGQRGGLGPPKGPPKEPPKEDLFNLEGETKQLPKEEPKLLPEEKELKELEAFIPPPGTQAYLNWLATPTGQRADELRKLLGAPREIKKVGVPEWPDTPEERAIQSQVREAAQGTGPAPEPVATARAPELTPTLTAREKEIAERRARLLQAKQAGEAGYRSQAAGLRTPELTPEERQALATRGGEIKELLDSIRTVKRYLSSPIGEQVPASYQARLTENQARLEAASRRMNATRATPEWRDARSEYETAVRERQAILQGVERSMRPPEHQATYDWAGQSLREMEGKPPAPAARTTRTLEEIDAEMEAIAKKRSAIGDAMVEASKRMDAAKTPEEQARWEAIYEARRAEYNAPPYEALQQERNRAQEAVWGTRGEPQVPRSVADIKQAMGKLDEHDPDYLKKFAALEEELKGVKETARVQEAYFGTPEELGNVEAFFGRGPGKDEGISGRVESFEYGGVPTSSKAGDIAVHYSTPDNPLTASFGKDAEHGNYVVFENETTGGKVYIKHLETNQPYIYSLGAKSKGKVKGGGQQMVQAAMSWARNNGIDLYKDYAITTINDLRRLSNFLSSAYRHGGIRGKAKELAVHVSDVTDARTLAGMQVDEARKVFDILDDFDWAPRHDLGFDGTHFTSHGKALSKEEFKGLVSDFIAHAKRRHPEPTGIGETTLKRAILTGWAMNVPRREVVEAAKRFGDKVLYALAGLSIGGLRERDEESP